MSKKNKINQKSVKKGFTLLELLVVILILGLLAAFVVPNIVGAGDKAKRDLVCSQMGSIANALDMFKMDNGTYPDTEEGLKALVKNPDSDKYPTYSSKPYMKRVPKDSWGQPIQYIKNGDGFELISFGADRKEGGTGDGADIKYSECTK
ncbi:MAG: type II secretion system major pseudopilin GspG [Epsilonproteobacteria bacterium]|nr:type II secretion system major pseudopilin GspG [Campylobacterota bacterium]